MRSYTRPRRACDVGEKRAVLMSALEKADIATVPLNVRFTPKSGH
jgi:hypothetical protein